MRITTLLLTFLALMATGVSANDLPDRIFDDNLEGEEACAFRTTYDYRRFPSLARNLDVDLGQPDLLKEYLPVETVTPGATDWLYEHIVGLDTRVTPRGYLAVYLMGAANRPPDQSEESWLDVAAGFGYHVLVMAYPQNFSVARDCVDSNCRGLKRLESLEGLDYSPLLEISRENSMEGRLRDLLHYLAANRPGQDWGYFLTQNGEIDYQKVVLAGHSHGGDNSALWGSYRRVARVVSTGSSGDSFEQNPAGWTCAPPTTPRDRYFSFNHVDDPAYDAFVRNAIALGFEQLGGNVIVDDTVSPYGNAHFLSATLAVARPHACTRIGAGTDCEAVYEDVFRYILAADGPVNSGD